MPSRSEVRPFLALLAGALALLSSMGPTYFLYGAASLALDEAQHARLSGTGQTAALLIGERAPTAAQLSALIHANALDGAYVVDRDYRVVADASPLARARIDLLRTDTSLLDAALDGTPQVGPSFQLEALEVTTGYFPLPAKEGARVLALEVGHAFRAPRDHLERALLWGAVAAALGAGALAVAALSFSRSEAARRKAATEAAHALAVAQMGAMAAHELRNPLAIIRGTIELMRERDSAVADAQTLAATEDLLTEVSRMRRLTDDFLDLAANRPLNLETTDLPALLNDTARAVERSHPHITVDVQSAKETTAPILADRERLRQVFLNLLTNAAQAQAHGTLEVLIDSQGDDALVRFKDHGPGMPAEVRARLFEPFVTGKPTGTGLGLTLSRRLVERHGGTLRLIEATSSGTTFEVRLPPRAGATT